MSLVDEMLEPFAIMDKTRVADGEGGYITEWTQGATISAVVVLDSSTQALIAEAQGVTSTYTVTTHKNVTLEYHDVIKRLSDGKIFRITSDANDKKSPSVSSLNMSQCKAEKWSLT